jgi:tetratricopeptide (TPR) repeat protein
MKAFLIGLFAGLILLTGTTQAMDESIFKAEQYWKGRSQKGTVERAISTLESALVKDAANYDALWRLGRYYQFLGDIALDKKVKLEYYQKGLIYAEKAVDVNDNGPDGHLQYAILLGCVSMEGNVLKGLQAIQTIHEELNTALILDPLNARIHNTLAVFYWKVPGKPLSLGNKKKAQAEAALAVKYDPKVIYYWLVYGQIANANKDFSTARMALGKVLELPGDLEDPSDMYYKDWADKELKKLPMA